MWSVKLQPSQGQLILLSSFYCLFIITMILMLYETEIDQWTSLCCLLLVLEWWRGYRYLVTIKGELALFPPSTELYWRRQRWCLVGQPLFLRYFVIIHLQSIRHHKKRVLFLMYDSFSPHHWRSLHYYLRVIVMTKQDK